MIWQSQEFDLTVEEAEEYAAQIGSLITISEVYGGLPSGGNAGEILIKNSDEDYDAIWGIIKNGANIWWTSHLITQGDTAIYTAKRYVIGRTDMQPEIHDFLVGRDIEILEGTPNTLYEIIDINQLVYNLKRIGNIGENDYNRLLNKPQIDGIEINKNSTSISLGLATASALEEKYTKPSDGIPASDLAEGVIPEVHNIPSGGSVGQAVIKNSSEDYDVIWSDIDNELPAVSSIDYGKVLTVSNNGIWNAQQPIFMVTITNNNNVFSADKTFSEIINAAKRNMIIVATYAGAYYQYCGVGSGVSFRQFVYIFTKNNIQTIKLFSVNTSNVWTQYQYQLGTYSKPDSGIPASDLADDVQSQLFTSEERTKLAGIEAGAEVNKIEHVRVIDPVTGIYNNIPIVNKAVDIPKQGATIFDFVYDEGLADGSFALSPTLDEVLAAGPDAIARFKYYGEDYETYLNVISNTGTFIGLYNNEIVTIIYANGDTWGLAEQFIGGGASNYSDLPDKPQINSVTLDGNKTTSELGLSPEMFVVTVTGTNPNFTADKTYAEITAAVAANRPMKLVKGDDVYEYAGLNDHAHYFTRSYIGGNSRVSISSTNEVTAGSLSYGTYSKPSGGIPKTDLASDVQTSLGKADTALQPGDVAEPFVVTYSTNDFTNWTCDKTYTQIVTAATSGLPVVCYVVVAGNPALQISSVEVGSSMELIFRYYVDRGNSFRIEHDSTDFILSHTESIAPIDIGAVAVAQGADHAGEFVVVGSDGNITTVTMTAWQGGSY